MTKRRGDVASRGAAYWITLGFSGRTARGLVAAGYRKLDDLKGMSREEVLAIPGFGERTLPLAERLLGSAFPSPREELRERGLPRVLSFALVKAGVDSWEKVERMTREQFIAVGNLGASSLGQLEALLGRRLDSPVQQLCAQGLERPTAYRLASAGVRDLLEVAEHSDESLRASGLTAKDVAACRRLIQRTKAGRP
jgi:hypothetical protein